MPSVDSSKFDVDLRVNLSVNNIERKERKYDRGKERKLYKQYIDLFVVSCSLVISDVTYDGIFLLTISFTHITFSSTILFSMTVS